MFVSILVNTFEHFDFLENVESFFLGGRGGLFIPFFKLIVKNDSVELSVYSFLLSLLF